MAHEDTATDDRAAAPPALGDGLIGVLLGGDGLRAIAALMIFFGHVFVNADPGAGVRELRLGEGGRRPAGLGLGLFFALSGYLITRPFLRSYILATKRPSVRRFARNRVLRIVPAFYVIAAIVLLRFGLDGAISPTPDNPSGTGPPSAWWQVLSVFTFTQSYTGGSATLPLGQAWSLDAEAAYYIADPARGRARLPPRRPHRDPARPRESRARRHRRPRPRQHLPAPGQRRVRRPHEPAVHPLRLRSRHRARRRRAARSRRACARTRARAKRLAWALVAIAVLAWALYPTGTTPPRPPRCTTRSAAAR